MNVLVENLKYLLWKKGIGKEDWVPVLAASLGCDHERAKSLLEDSQLGTSLELEEAIAQFGEMDLTALRTRRLWTDDQVDTMSANLAFLLDSLPHGEKKNFAEKIGVDATTISRWGSGKQRPTKKKIHTILNYFNLPESANLNTELFFLSTAPLGEVETKRWLKEKVDNMDPVSLRQLFPSLKKLFE